ncbi:MAG: sensor histidine kinase [Chloroflexota bacterium]
MVSDLQTDTSSGLALLCDQDGVILRVLRDELGAGGEQLVGRPLTRVVDEGSVRKALSFLIALRQQEAVFDWELNVPIGGAIQTLHFAGGAVGGRLLIVAAANGAHMLSMYEEMVRIGNEQVNALRAAFKEQAEEQRRAQEHDTAHYDEISRLNNELGVMQREMAKKNAELERLNELKNQFLGMAAHDLRNPLQAIQGFAEFLRDNDDTLPVEERRELLEIILRSSRFMGELVNDLLDVARIESGKLALNLAALDLVELARKNVELNRTLAAGKGIELQLECEQLPPISADHNKIEQVFNNLISNAIKYSHPDSRVTVSLTHPAEDHVLIAVSDEGQGIPADQLDRLFRPFSTTTVRGTGGEKSTGLGLVIVRKIVEGHGGTIRVESEVGVGSTFYVTLPAGSDEGAARG